MEKQKKQFKINMAIIFMITIVFTMAVCLVSINSIVVPSSEDAVTNEVINNLKTAVDGKTLLIDEYIADNELVLRQYGTAPIVKEFLQNPDDAELQAAAQKYTENFFANLNNWEGVYISNWNTQILAHSNPPVVGMITREGDALPPYQATMTGSPDGFYDGGVFSSPASGLMILNMRMGIQDDDGNFIGLVGGGPFIKGLDAILAKQTIQGFSNAKSTIIDTANGVYVTNADESLVGQPIDNVIHQDVLAKVNGGDMNNYIEEKGEIVVWKAIPEQHIAVVVEDSLKEALGVVDQMTVKVAIVTAIIVIVMLIIGFVAANMIVKPLKDIANVTKRLSEGYIRDSIETKSFAKETQDIIDAAKILQANLVGIVDNIKNTSTDLATSVVDTSELCSNSAAGAGQITDAVDELSNATVSMAESVQLLAGNMGEIDQCIENINVSTNALAQSSSVMNKISDEAKSDILSVAESASKSVEAVDNITAHMDELSRSISEITQATELIASISSQTALLSLNASIEAARAGDAGRGFAVVATEISKLAEQSDAGTKQIDDITRKVLELSSKSKELTEGIAEIIRDEQERVNETERSFLQLKEQIDESVSQIGNIAEDMKSLNMSKESANEAVSELSAISEENAASNEQVNASIMGLSANITDISDRSANMSSMAGVLTDAIKAFKD